MHQQQQQQLQHHWQQLRTAIQQLHGCAVASLRPGASRHAAAIASIQVRAEFAWMCACLLMNCLRVCIYVCVFLLECMCVLVAGDC